MYILDLLPANHRSRTGKLSTLTFTLMDNFKSSLNLSLERASIGRKFTAPGEHVNATQEGRNPSSNPKLQNCAHYRQVKGQEVTVL